jgi:imidazoleglycerol-phosphate dehydratase
VLKRVATIARKTKETDIKINLNIDGSGKGDISTSIAFFDHMMELFTVHGLFDLRIEAKGDLEVDAHHTIEDVGLCLGEAFNKALGECQGIVRYGQAILPMDEVLMLVAVDISGRPFLSYNVELPIEIIGSYDTTLTVEFLQAFVNQSRLDLHVKPLELGNAHHMVEAIFKGLGRALDQATRIDQRVKGVPSSKGKL